MRWMWIDRIVRHEAGRRLVAIKNVTLAEEYLHDHFPASGDVPARPVMPASLLIEGMAQTAGILVGTMSRFEEKVILAKIARARFDTEVLPGQTVRFDATLERFDKAGAATHGLIERLDHPAAAARDGTPYAGQWEAVGEVDLLFSHLDTGGAGLGIPEDNFVFSDNFRDILRTAGLDY